MSSKSTLSVCVLALVCLFGSSIVKADAIPVANGDFSQLGAPLSYSCGANCNWNVGPIPGWTMTPGTSAGTAELNSAYYTTLPAGETYMAYINGGELTQDLGIGLLADTTYTLTVDVGHRLDGDVTNYSFGFEAGSATLAWSDSNGTITPGTFAPESISFTTGSTVAPGDLTIFLSGAGPQADFEDVSVTAVPTPEPSTLLLLGLGLAGLLVVGTRCKNNVQFSN